MAFGIIPVHISSIFDTLGMLIVLLDVFEPILWFDGYAQD